MKRWSNNPSLALSHRNESELFFYDYIFVFGMYLFFPYGVPREHIGYMFTYGFWVEIFGIFIQVVNHYSYDYSAINTIYKERHLSHFTEHVSSV